MRGLSSCGSRAQLLRGMWDLPRPGLEPVSPALAGRFSTTAPPGKPYVFLYILFQPTAFIILLRLKFSLFFASGSPFKLAACPSDVTSVFFDIILAFWLSTCFRLPLNFPFTGVGFRNPFSPRSLLPYIGKQLRSRCGDQDTNRYQTNTFLSIGFHKYQILPGLFYVHFSTCLHCLFYF